MAAGLFRSVSAARKTVRSGGLYLNNARVPGDDATLDDDDFLHGRFAVVRRGKKSLGVVQLAHDHRN